MATIDLRDPALREKYGLRLEQGIETVSIPYQWMKKQKRDYQGREETKQAIVQALQASDRPLSRREILRAIGREKCPYLLDVIAEMVAAGLLVEHESSYRHLLMFVYEVA